ncbi:MAG TPA: patatin-like phospholipase family protein [Dehalococcoidia bacterium]|nr:patatin-like phospholipase family protein [Dehalococcoidia bacterium]
MARRFLLSVDGGGIRGVIPATVLRKLEEQTGQPARETFDFLAGTSTGAIIAGGLAAGISAARIRDMYLERSDEIFGGNSVINFIQRIVRGYMYSTTRFTTSWPRRRAMRLIGPSATPPLTSSSQPRQSRTVSPGTSSRTTVATSARPPASTLSTA